jgi:uncharacterized protein YggE
MKKDFTLAILVFVMLAISVRGQEDCCRVNTITTLGTSTVNITPDIAEISITANAYNTTSAAALSNANILVDALIAVFDSFNITADDYSTSSITLTQQINYSYSPYYVIGQSAQQTILLTVTDLPNLSNIIKGISNVNVQINFVQFYTSNP